MTPEEMAVDTLAGLLSRRVPGYDNVVQEADMVRVKAVVRMIIEAATSEVMLRLWEEPRE